jgi:hypothetical protein
MSLKRHGRIHIAPSWMDSRRNVLFACGALRILFCILSGAWFISGVTGTLNFIGIVIVTSRH